MCARKRKTVRNGIGCETQAKTVEERGNRARGREDRKSGKPRLVGRAWNRGRGERRAGRKGTRKVRGRGKAKE